MTEEEVRSAIRSLRAFMADQGMQWVLDEVDEAIALGVPETRTLRQTSRQGQTTYVDVTQDALLMLEQGTGRPVRHSEEFVRSRPMTQFEQARLLVQALTRVLVDLDAVATGSLQALNPEAFAEYSDPDFKPGGPRIRVPQVEGISFATDEGSTAPGISVNVLRDSARGERVASLLRTIEEEIDS